MTNSNEVLIGSGKTPEGVAVKYYEADRPETMGAKGSLGFVILVRDASSGARITHSDTVEGLKKAGFAVDALGIPEDPIVTPPPAPVVPEPAKSDADIADKDDAEEAAPEKSIEDELAS